MGVLTTTTKYCPYCLGVIPEKPTDLLLIGEGRRQPTL